MFHIINKKTGEIVNSEYRYESKAFFSFHHANVYEENGKLSSVVYPTLSKMCQVSGYHWLKIHINRLCLGGSCSVFYMFLGRITNIFKIFEGRVTKCCIKNVPRVAGPLFINNGCPSGNLY